MPSIIVNNHVNSLQITFWKILDPIINCFTTQIFTSGHEWNHNQNGNHFVSQHKYLSPSLQRTFLLKFSLFFFLEKIKLSQRVFERKQQREVFFYIFSWVISGSFWQYQLPINWSPPDLWFVGSNWVNPTWAPTQLQHLLLAQDGLIQPINNYPSPFS